MRTHHCNTQVFPPSNPVSEGWQRLLIETEQAQGFQTLSADQIGLLQRAYRAGVEAKADEVQPMIAKIELRARRQAHHEIPVKIVGSN